MDRQDILNSLKSYDPNFDGPKVNKAIDFAIHYHGSQTRESGDPYYHHPLEVAEIIIKMRLDSNSVITALLHDTVEDTELTLEEINDHFGSEVAKLVDGVTKLSKLEFLPDHLRQAENFRKLLLAMSEDIRVLLVKLADRLHNMRTIDDVKAPEKRARIALETMEIYAPLAERIGIQQIKSELQDICFRILQPEIRDSILSRLKAISKDETHVVDRIVNEIQGILNSAKVKAKVYGRQKTPYSIWMKMKQKNIGLDQLSDIIAFRIIVDNIPECYQALGTIHTEYKMVPESFQDFISTPKNNGYQSLHTVVIGPLQQKIEVQIRTKEMHEIAELGVAAHWRYKQKHHDAADGKQYRWIRELLAILEQASDPEDFLRNTKLAMYYDQVFCFSPQGKLIALPRGATPIDFAYAVHSDVGHHCVGAKVNSRIVPLRSVLNNGDQVEIVTSKNQFPSPAWEKFVVTGKARSEIRRFIRGQQKEQYTKLGKNILEKALKVANIKDTEKVLNNAISFFKKPTINDLFCAVGEGTLSREEVVKYLLPKKSTISSTIALLSFKKHKDKDTHQDNAVPIRGLIAGMAMHFAGCCHPIPGDEITGVIHTGSGVTVHTKDCEMLSNFATMPERLINLTWDSEKSNIPLVCRLKITATNEQGSLAALSSEIAKEKGNITNFKIINRSTEFFELIFDVEVYNIEHIDSIIRALKAKSNIHHAARA